MLNVLDMPWNYFHAWPDEDAQAIAQYLKSLPPVKNRIPSPLHYGFVETVARKLVLQWPAFPPAVLVFVDGNFGQSDNESVREWPQEYLLAAQWFVIVLGVFLFVVVGPDDRVGHVRVSWWRRTGGPGLLVFIVSLLGWLVYHLPVVSFVPPEQIALQFLDRVPVPAQTEHISPEQSALVERGHLLYTVASCALCHHPEGDGGLKISWKAFGTLWTRNITSDPATGIGR